MQSLIIVVMNKHCKPLADAQPTAHPRMVETVDSHLERVKPLFDLVSVGVIDPTVES